ncbi:MAG: radical SAM protein [Firmicutes bacterium]|nr:radical SAM protein [Bacillota bacterium]
MSGIRSAKIDWAPTGELKEWVLLNIPITGKCNFKCKMCAYTLFRDYDRFDLKLLSNIIRDVETLIKTVNAKFVVVFTGGEPTYDIDHLVVVARQFINLRDKYPTNITTALPTNGYYGSSQELINRVEALNFNIIQFTMAENHYECGNLPYLINIVKNSKTTANLGAATVGDEEKIEALYKPLLDIWTPASHYWHYPLRYIKFYKFMIPTGLVQDEYGSQNDFSIDGIYVHRDGLYPICPGEGTESACFLGKHEDFIKVYNKIVKSPQLCISMKGYNFQKLHPMCRFLKECGIDCCCLDNEILHLDYNEDTETLEVVERIKYEQ